MFHRLAGVLARVEDRADLRARFTREPLPRPPRREYFPSPSGRGTG
jgi:hypothetical protein